MKRFFGIMALAFIFLTSCVLYALYLKSVDVDLKMFDKLMCEDVDSYRAVFNSKAREIDQNDGRRIVAFLRSAAESGRHYQVTSKSLIHFGRLQILNDNKVLVTIDLNHGGDGLVFFWRTAHQSHCITSTDLGKEIMDILEERTMSKPDLDE